MNTKIKTTRRAKKRTASINRKKVALVGQGRPALRHFRIISHKHTFRLIHFRHTSHLSLFLILLFVGFFLLASDQMAKAVPAPQSGTVQVGVIVPGPPPPIGATITSPEDNAVIKDNLVIGVSGTCYADSFVVVKSNDSIVGSTACSSDGLFALQVQLDYGKNTLTALNYDNLNQAGPTTPSVTINIVNTKIIPPGKPDRPLTSTKSTTTITTLEPFLPDNPSILTGLNSNPQSCNEYNYGKLPSGGMLRVAVVCVPRLFIPKAQQVMGVLVWGGTPPYALSVNFGSESVENSGSTLLSLANPGYAKIKFSYAVPNTYKIKFRLVDKTNNTAIVETAVQVSGEPQKTTPSSIVNDISKTVFNKSSWFESPVPFYLLAVAITLGFWGGDIFDRRFGSGKIKPQRRSRSVA